MRNLIKKYIESKPNKIVEKFDIENNLVKYNCNTNDRNISKLISEKEKGQIISEEMTRAYLLTKLCNELGYKIDRIELEKEYKSGRPNTITSRIDVIVKDKNNNAFMFIELKSPTAYDSDNKDQIIEDQLFKLAPSEEYFGHKVKYLVLYSFDIIDGQILDKCIIIDHDKFKTFDSWKDIREASDTIPERYSKAQKEPYEKGGKKDLLKSYSKEQIDSLRRNLHNVLWGGGGTDDNDVFSSLVNIILAKIQDESEKTDGQKYDFQSFSYMPKAEEEEQYETNAELFERINKLYRRALKQRLNILDEERLNKSYVIDENKFSLAKLKYAVSELEKYSFVDGKNNFDGKDILGDFFEGIIRTGFKQSKGQFFTHVNIVKFILWALEADKLAINKVNNDLELPYMIDPSAGSGTFLIEYMKFITNCLKYRFKDKLNKNRDVEDKFEQWFKPDHRENKWAKDYIYGVEHNFNLGTATKVNMILHGDGSTNIFVTDGLLPFNYYTKETAPNFLNHKETDSVYGEKEVNKQFDILMSNPPFSVDLDNETKKTLGTSFLYGDKKNSENLFIERYYQLLRENGRMGIVLPESVYDTTENKYIRLFLYKYFKIKAVVSLPQLTFEPYTSTKTSILFAQKKTKEEIEQWNELWNKYSKEYSNLATRIKNYLDVYLKDKDRNKLPSIKNHTKDDEVKNLKKFLKNFICDEDKDLMPIDIIQKYKDEINDILDKDLIDTFGRVNTWWVFGEVAKEYKIPIFMAEADNVGYKRTKRGENFMSNDLYQENSSGDVIFDIKNPQTVLDFMRKANIWE